MKTLFTDASFDFQSEKVNGKDHVIGKTAIVGEGITKVELAYLERIPGLVQYINVLETLAVARAVGMAIENGWHGELAIRTDSRVAVAWCRHGPRSQIVTPVHIKVLRFLRERIAVYDGNITVDFVSRWRNPAGKVLEQELLLRRPCEL